MFDGYSGNGFCVDISELDFCAGLWLTSGLSNHCSYIGWEGALVL